jgi:hypothetical protein
MRPASNIVAILIFTSLGVACNRGQSATAPEEGLPAIDGAAIRAHVSLLADDLYEGREAGKRGYELAARYVAAQYQTIGLAPGNGDSYFQTVPFRVAQVVPGSRALTIESAQESQALETFGDFTSSPTLAGDQVSITAPLVYVGYGVNIPSIERNDYDGVDLRGKIAVVVRGAPAGLSTEVRSFYRSDTHHKSIELEQRGAVGIISLQHRKIGSEAASIRGSKAEKYWVLGGEHGEPQFGFEGIEASVFVTESGARKLFADSPLTFDDMAAGVENEDYEPMELGISATIGYRMSGGSASADNVVAVLEGSDPDVRDEYVLLSAHLDGVGMGDEPDDRIYNGYYDNASGIGTMLEVARALAAAPERPRRSIIFLATTAEEKGLLGAEYYAANPTVPVQNIVANVNMDMVMFLWRARDVVGFGAQHSTLQPVLKAAARVAGVDLSPDPFPERGYFTRSDQFPFVQRGIPAVFLATGFDTGEPGVDPEALYNDFMQNHYHGPTDDERLRFDERSAERVALVNYLMTLEIANAAERPTWVPDNFFGNLYGTDATLPAD